MSQDISEVGWSHINWMLKDFRRYLIQKKIGGPKQREEQELESVILFIYIFLNISLIGSVGSRVLANSQAPLATASGLILKQSQSIVALIGIVAMLSAINAYMLAGSRVLQNITSLSYDNHELHVMNQLNVLSSKGTPAAAIIVITLASCISPF